MTTQQKIAQFHMRNGSNIRHNFHQNMQQRVIHNPQHQQQNQQPQPQFQHPQQQQFSKQAVDVAKDTEKLQNDQQRLTSLHSKLHKEAEKIRHWKSEKEAEIKQKDRSLSDAIQTIDSLRKSIIELQFQNEEFSIKLHDKELEKEETEQKMCTVREMANVLRDQMMQLENRIAQGEQDKEDVTQINQNMIEENQALVLKFQELDINQATLIEKHMKQVNQLESKHELEVKDLQTNIRHLENQLISLMDTKTSQEKSLNEYATNLKENKEMLAKLQEQFQKKTEQLQQAEQVMFSQEQSLTQSNANVEQLSVKLQEIQQNLVDTTANWKAAEEEKNTQQQHAKEVKDIYSNEINSLQSDLKELSSTLQQKTEEIESLVNDKEEKSKTISQIEKEKSDREMINEKLNLRISELEQSNSKLEEIKQDLSEKIDSYSESIASTEAQVSNISEQYAILEEQIKLSEEQKETLIQQKSALEEEISNTNIKVKQFEETLPEKENIIKGYMDHIDELKQKLEANERSIEILTGQKHELESKYREMTEERDIKTQEIQELRKLVEEKETQLVIHQRELESALKEIENLKEVVSTQEQKLIELEEKGQEKAETMKSELAGQEKMTEDLGNKTKSLQSQVNIKTKQVKNLEKENKNLKNQLKKLSDKNSKIDEQVKVLQEEAKATTEILDKTRQELETAKLNEQQCKKQFDIDQKEFCATLEQYKLENDKIVEGYLNENAAMKKQLGEIQQNASDEQESFRRQLAESNGQIEKQKAMICELETTASKTTAIKDEKIAELENAAQAVKEQIELEQRKHEQLQKDYEIVVEEVEELKRRPVKVVKENHGQDRLVPTTPKIPTTNLDPITPQSILRNSQSNRGKRVLFAGVHNKENSSPMETDEAPIKPKTPKTPTIPTNKVKLSNIRFSPKPSPHLLQQNLEEERKVHSPGPQAKSLNRISRKPTEEKKSSNNVGKFKSTNINELVDGHYNAAQKSPVIKKNIYGTPKGAISRIKRSAGKTSSPGDVERSQLKNKMKKMRPNIKKNSEQNLSWFDADSVFGFD